MPEISIIVPVYKVEEYLPRCIDSILAQSFTDFELILVDDGSPDNCGTICDEYANKDKRIIVIHKENGGLSDARNAGLDIAKGKYIGFVDSDDWIESNMYQYLHDNIIANDADIAECFYRRTNEKGKADFDELQSVIQTGEEAVIQIYTSDIFCNIVVWNKLYDATLFEQLRFPKGRINEDQFVTPRLLASAEKVFSGSYIGYNYFIRENSITNSSYSKKNLDEFYALKETKDFYKENKINGVLKYHNSLYFSTIIKHLELCKKNEISKVYTSLLYKDIIVNSFDFFLNNQMNFKEKVFFILRVLKTIF